METDIRENVRECVRGFEKVRGMLLCVCVCVCIYLSVYVCVCARERKDAADSIWRCFEPFCRDLEVWYLCFL